MRVAIRADAGRHIGAGHVMRCLTLGEALRDRGADVTFLCRAFEGHLMDRIRRDGFAVEAFPVEGVVRPTKTGASPPHAGWLGTSLERDRDLTHDALGRLGGVDLLIVDHYALDSRWERGMRDIARRILVIDDLADRPHDADWLLDQTYGRRTDAYEGLVPPACRLLLGSDYALLRPEFAALRAETLNRRVTPPARLHLLVHLGGTATECELLGVIAALKMLGPRQITSAQVVLGTDTQPMSRLRQTAAKACVPISISGQVDEMAGAMAEADIAIGGAGGAAWERCCLGLPSLLVIMAENQRLSAKTLAELGAARSLGEMARITPAAIADALETLLSDREALVRMSRTAASYCNGFGCARILDVLLTEEVSG